MHILLLTDNFPPETNAPATRTYEHARHWVELGHEVTIVTGVPNFPRGVVHEGYRNRPIQREVIDGIQVVRVWTYIAANSGFARRTLDYISFMLSGALAGCTQQRPDIVVATSPQFFTSIAGWLVAARHRRPWVFELRDLWPESIAAVGALSDGPALRALERLARFLYRQADLIVPVTQAFVETVRAAGVPDERICVVTNGIDADKLSPSAGRDATRTELGLPAEAFVAGYVGTLGMAHGLEVVLRAARITRDNPNLRYLLVGEGADKAALLERLEREGLESVTVLDGRPRKEALAILDACDAALVVLRDTPLFRTVLPSKIFEAMALAKPIVLGVRGEAHRVVVEEAECGLAFDPADAEGLAWRLEELAADPERALALGRNGRQHVEVRYRRSDLARRMLAAIEAVMKKSGQPTPAERSRA